MTTLRVWAPGKETVEVEVEGDRTPLTSIAGGWWQVELPEAGPGTDYAFVVDGGQPRPDPRSSWQPSGVHGPSRLVDHEAFAWTDALWRGLPLPGAVLYELHIGTFTPEGTFDAAIERLDHLVELGVDAVELLPCNAFAGERGWGYDGVAWYAVHDPYGGPEGLKRFVDACHARGLGVVMDVVYNHLGPAGNYLPEFGPYLTEAHTTPWGSAVNLDVPGSDEVRRYIVDNALMWLRDYHVDGLRLDAVHALVDERATHLLEELAVDGRGARRAAAQAAVAGRRERPQRRRGWSARARPAATAWTGSGPTTSTTRCTPTSPASWRATTATSAACRCSPRPCPACSCTTGRGRASASAPTAARCRPPCPGTGSWSTCRTTTRSATGRPATASRRTLSDGLLKVGAALLLTSPYTPMLFMGEEWGARTPWQFFSDHEGELGDAVREGRRAEFASHGWKTTDVPDPQSEQTFRDSTLDWSELEGEREQGAAGLDARPAGPAPQPARAHRRPPRPGAGRVRRGRPLADRAARAASSSPPTCPAPAPRCR